MAKKIRSHPKYFKLYKLAKSHLTACETYRGTTFAIAVADDAWAKRWQQIKMRVEILDAFLEGRNPNWFNCTYLKNEEMERRNSSYLNP